jgi:L-arabonate dehydrase
MKHRGRAVVFQSIEHYRERIGDPNLDVSATSILVLQNCGPKGYPGMPEVGNMGLPPKLLEQGITDMVRISDARMSGTAYGTVVLHVCPEAAAGGPLGLVREGDIIEIDVAARRLHLEVTEDELDARRAGWKPDLPPVNGGYQGLYVEHVMQASEGADFDFLVGCRGTHVPRESH